MTDWTFYGTRSDLERVRQLGDEMQSSLYRYIQ
jgi:hypothetical protein